MANRSITGIAVLPAVLLVSMPNSRAQERIRPASDLSNPPVESSPGIRRDRLLPRQRRAWRAIESIVFARDDSGRFTHPTLHDLWQRAETSGHVIYVQLVGPKNRWDHQAGKFMIEKFDPDGQRHIASILLCLPVIDRAGVRKRFRGEDGFIPYEGLRKKERYAEALGHELAHAVWALSDPEHARLIENMYREVDEFNSRRRAVHGEAWSEQMRQDLKRVQSWIAEIEKPAEAAEIEVWRELRSRGGRVRVSVSPAGTPIADSAGKKR